MANKYELARLRLSYLGSKSTKLYLRTRFERKKKKAKFTFKFTLTSGDFNFFKSAPLSR